MPKSNGEGGRSPARANNFRRVLLYKPFSRRIRPLSPMPVILEQYTVYPWVPRNTLLTTACYSNCTVKTKVTAIQYSIL